MLKFKISKRIVSENSPPLIIPEIGINHYGNLDMAIYLADCAIKNGAEIIKHQTHIPDDEMSFEARRVIPENAKTSIYNIIKKNCLTEDQEIKFCNYVRSKKIIYISTPFSRLSAERLVRLKVPAFKVGSGEANNFHFIKFLCKFKKPIILSTGMNTLNNLKKSIDVILKKKIPLAILHCTNIYPTPSKYIRLGCIELIKKKYPNCIVGLSDHSENIYNSLGAVALGARIIEKHFIDSKKRKGPDISSSMDINEFKELLKGSSVIFDARGSSKEPLREESKTMAFAFSSVVSLEDIYPGQNLTKTNIFLKRPGTGDYGVNDLGNLYGKKVKMFIKANTQIKKKQLI